MKRSLSVVFLALVFLSLVPSAAFAQPAVPGGQTSRSEEECKKKVEDLERRLNEANQRIRELMKQNEELRRGGSGGGGTSGGGGGSKQGGSDSASPAAPLSSPKAMYDALVADYEARFASMPRDTIPQQNKLMDAVREWTREQARSMRGPVEWNVEVVETRSAPGARAVEVTMQVLDRTGKAVGGPETALLPRAVAKDLSKGKKYMLKATASAKPEFNAKRGNKGNKDTPRFIGPYAEFGFEIEVAEVNESPEKP